MAFGEIALITKQKRTGTIATWSKVCVITLSKFGFDKILGKYNENLKKNEL